ncbi:MAG: N-acetylglucosamine-6-phosphate deacetylase, partial [Clostridia bacterium]|nr:N-acetylglucosamine-6-phosphate deacetylase [Clostridia bacterium]
MKAIINGRIVTPTGTLEGKALLFDEKIRGIVSPAEIGDAEVIDAEGKYVVPGLIDMHIHGYQGADASDGDAEAVVRMAEGLAKNGVTAWLPTTMTISYEALYKAFDSIRVAMKNNPNGAIILGVNSEGPFICESKKGAQNGAHIRPCDV